MALDNTWIVKKIMDNPFNKLTLHISGDNACTIQGFTTADTMIGTSAQYEEVGDSLKSALGSVAKLALGKSTPLGWINKLLGDDENGTGGFFSEAQNIIGAAGKVLGFGKTVPGSVRAWSGSNIFVPQLQVIFVALSPNDKPQDKAKQILCNLLPGKSCLARTPWIGEAADKVAQFFYHSPRGYSPLEVLKKGVEETLGGQLGGYGGDIYGTCTIEIGTWFKMDGLLLTNAQFEFSKETTKQGNPLYVTGSIEFEPYRDLKHDDLMKMFK